MKTKIFISYASEDKLTMAIPLAEALREGGFEVRSAEYSLTLPDGLKDSIEEGTRNHDCIVIILGSSFFEKSWTKSELSTLFNRELYRDKIIFPLWHDLTQNARQSLVPLLIDEWARISNECISKNGNASQIIEKINKAAFDIKEKSFDITVAKEDNLIVFSSIKGAEMKKHIITYFSEEYSIERADIDDASIVIYEDFSGIDEYQSYFLLKDGSKIIFNDEYILRSTKFSHPIVRKSYEPVEWDMKVQSFDKVDFDEDEDNLPKFEDIEIYIIFLKGGFINCSASAENILKLEAILQMEACWIDCLEFGFIKGIFYSQTTPSKILNNMLVLEKIDKIESWIFHPRTWKPFKFTVSARLIEYYLENANQITQPEKWILLIKKIAEVDDLLNEYLQEKIEHLLA